jgi:putative ATPase
MSDSLFAEPDEPPAAPPPPAADAPLAERLRPRRWEDFQAEAALDPTLLGQLQAGRGRPPSLVLWGPPGCGKTTFAKLVGQSFKLPFEAFSAVLGGVAEVRELVAAAKKRRGPTVLFVDEIHRFNKSQQDAFLPHVEAGTIVLIGATTENPAFALTGALLSRCRVLPLPALGDAALRNILADGARAAGLALAEGAAEPLLFAAGGDARRLLNLAESLRAARPAEAAAATADEVRAFLARGRMVSYDRAGDQHYDMASALVKSLRGSDPDAALYWAFRMLAGGEDAKFVLRRMVIFASEDIGNADPHALPLAVAAAAAYDRLGDPEGRIPLAHALTYLACAPKSNRSYLAMHAAVAAAGKHPRVRVPAHLCNAPTAVHRQIGAGVGYQYPHDHPEGFVPGVRYLPEELGPETFYDPGPHGTEAELRARMVARGQRPK